MSDKGPNEEMFDTVCAAVNDEPVLQSLLYDLDLLPEQTYGKQRWLHTVNVVMHVLRLKDQMRKGEAT